MKGVCDSRANRLLSLTFSSCLAGLLIYITLLDRHAINDIMQIPRGALYVTYTIYGLFFAWASFRYQLVLRHSVCIWPFVVLLAIISISSVINDPDLGALNIFISETLLGFMIAAECTQNKLMKLYALALGILLIINIGIIGFYPSIGITNGTGPQELKHAGAWRGTFWHKSEFGCFAGIVSVFFIYWYLCQQTVIRLIMIVLSLLCLFFSQSVTAILATAVSVIAMYGMFKQSLNPNIQRAMLFTGCLLPLLTIICMIIPHAMTFLPKWFIKDPTLSNRTKIWEEVARYGLNHPWFGFGFHFWQSPHGEYINKKLIFIPYWADNGLLEMYISVGFMGALMLCIIIAMFCTKLIRNIVLSTSDGNRFLHLWPLVYLTYFIAVNLTQSYTIRTHNLLWILFVISFIHAYLQPSVKKVED